MTLIRKGWVVLGMGVVALVSPARAMTVQDFVSQVAAQGGTPAASVLASLPHELDVKAPLTEGTVVLVMSKFGVKLRTSNPGDLFSDAGVSRILARAQPPTRSPQGKSPSQDRARSKSKTRPRHHPPHRRRR